MRRIKSLQLTQFFLYESVQFDLLDITGIVADNGNGKSSTLDALTTLITGGSARYARYNAQTEDTSSRTLKEYCLGVVREKSEDSEIVSNKRDRAISYICALIYDDERDRWSTVGLCVEASIDMREADIKGRFVAPGVKLDLGDYLKEGQNGVDQFPRPWEEVAETIRTRCKALGESHEFFNTGEKFSQAALLQMVGSTIDAPSFLRAFRTALTLNKIEGGIDKFVRDFLVDSRSVNAQQAMAQITELRRVLDLIEDVERRIKRLHDLRSMADRLANRQAEGNAYEVLAVDFEREQVIEEMARIEDQVESFEKLLSQGERQAASLAETIANERTRLEGIERVLSDDESQRQYDNITQLIDALEGTRKGSVDLVKRVVAPILTGLNSAVDHAWAQPYAGSIKAATDGIASALDRLTGPEGSSDALSSAVQHATSVLDELAGAQDVAQTHREAEAEALTPKLEELRHDLLEVEGKIAAGGLDLGHDARRALAHLRGHDITCAPVCSAVEVSDLQWQGAIENFLGSNLEAIVVEAGQEERANSLLMDLPREHRLPKAKVVEPQHFRREESLTLDRIASLIRPGGHPLASTASGYLRAVLGKMVKATSISDLRKNSRALMKEGAFSANYGIMASQTPVPQEKWRIGAKPTGESVSELQRQKKKLEADRGRIRARIAELSKPLAVLPQLPSRTEFLADLQAQLDKVSEESNRIQEYRRTQASIDTSQNEELLRQRKEAKDKLDGLETSKSENDKQLGSVRNQIENYLQKMTELKDQQTALHEQVTNIAKELDVDAELMDGLRSKLDDGQETTTVAKLQSCTRALSLARDYVKNHRDQFLRGVQDFERDFRGYNLMEERHDWIRARTFVHSEHKQLSDTTLVEYRQQVSRAREAAEEAFRASVALSIHEDVTRMRQNINRINKVLRECPAFTNGERYQFRWTYAPEHREIWEYINRAATSDGPLFSGEGGDKVVEMLEVMASRDHTAGPTPLDDFRLMFNFDIEVDVEGKVVSRLSNRLGGKGSGGEHRLPLYVVVAAALHHAYRVSDNTGAAAIMLIDEAFEKLDERNAIAIVDFMRAMNIQIVASATTLAYPLMVSCMDRVFSLYRFDDSTIHFEKVDPKFTVRDLMLSDHPDANPDLVKSMAAKFAAEA